MKKKLNSQQIEVGMKALSKAGYLIYEGGRGPNAAYSVPEKGVQYLLKFAKDTFYATMLGKHDGNEYKLGDGVNLEDLETEFVMSFLGIRSFKFKDGGTRADAMRLLSLIVKGYYVDLGVLSHKDL